MRLLHTVLTTASMQDWTTPLPIQHETVPGEVTTPGEAGSVKAVIPLSQELFIGASVEEGSSPMLEAQVKFAFSLREV
jgi:hypothetical protein